MKRNTYIHLKTLRHTNTEISVPRYCDVTQTHRHTRWSQYIHTYIYLNQATWPIDMTERIKEMHKTTKKEYTFTYMKRNTYIHLKTLRHTNTEISVPRYCDVTQTHRHTRWSQYFSPPLLVQISAVNGSTWRMKVVTQSRDTARSLDGDHRRRGRRQQPCPRRSRAPARSSTHARRPPATSSYRGRTTADGQSLRRRWSTSGPASTSRQTPGSSNSIVSLTVGLFWSCSAAQRLVGHSRYIVWQWRNFDPYLCQLRKMFAAVILLKYALLAS